MSRNIHFENSEIILKRVFIRKLIIWTYFLNTSYGTAKEILQQQIKLQKFGIDLIQTNSLIFGRYLIAQIFKVNI